MAVANDGISREDEWAHLRALSGQQDCRWRPLMVTSCACGSPGFTVKWELHRKFTRYSIRSRRPIFKRGWAAEPVLFLDIAVPAERGCAAFRAGMATAGHGVGALDDVARCRRSRRLGQPGVGIRWWPR